ncbi:MAG: NAD(P)H-dependent oxidoreductase, partial [Acidobacteriota bacterium]|nr:NAD(P)H-dependent oxidoreductase [Acidobacteriota bacterium]
FQGTPGMPALLAITSSPRGDYSVSNALTHTFIEAYKQAHAGATVVTRDLQKTDLPWINLPWMGGAFTPPNPTRPR